MSPRRSGGGGCPRGSPFGGGGVIAQGFAHAGDGVDCPHQLLGNDVDDMGEVYHGRAVVHLGRLQDQVHLVRVRVRGQREG